MKKITSLILVIGLVISACSDPNTLGIDVQPISDEIQIASKDFKGLNCITESEDSLRTDNALNLILGEITDPIFGVNIASFYTQILLTENNTDLGNNPTVDSVVLSYSFSGYYGDLDGFDNIDINQVYEDIYKDSIYYSNSFDIAIGSIDNIESFSLSNDLDNPFFKVKLKNEFGQQILDLGSDILKDNETFLEQFKAISVLVSSANTMLYLNPDNSDSYFKIYYHNDDSEVDTLSLDFTLGGDAVRMNLFNEKNSNSIIEDSSRVYVQSMAGYKIKISFQDTDSIKTLLDRKVINKVTMSFEVELNSQSEYVAHEKLVLVRVDDEGKNIFLTDFTIEGDAHFGGDLENDIYKFNITRYFYQLLNNDSYTKELYLLPAGALVNSNRTILNKDIKITINYSEL